MDDGLKATNFQDSSRGMRERRKVTPLAVTASSPAQNGGRIHEGSAFVQNTFRLTDSLG